ncbi:MAG: glycosyltransferase family 2 protein [Hydrotalea flava]|uniref:glycosyltransferase family 2 protein n=2 Tax=Chitinophagaceae TaxID=563835 RepID=UPI0009C19E59|nr:MULTISPECIES: glycosyltransferase family 2 protein [Hydrotalea]MBY0348506.1 glycosyltransferase family 2 protein [Hydrotalea flava]RWZ90588.1 MAG: glycosyltransferase family 2 protein [Hydrotalea sp. AMD]
MIEWVFWFSFAVMLYTYVLYPVILFLFVQMKQNIQTESNTIIGTNHIPNVTVIISAYNEADCINAKIQNSIALNYPADKISWIVVTDGSTDGTNKIVATYSQISLLHHAERLGKLHAMNRAVNESTADILVFTDANSILNSDCLHYMIPHFSNARTGAVSGEKKILIPTDADAMIGEGIYWKYESFIKKMESQFKTVIGMPGELFAIRKSLYPLLPPNTITEDFSIAMQVIASGYIIRYEPNAIAAENPSIHIAAEFNRKKRIAAGSIQTLLQTLHLCSPFKYPSIAFQYISHKVFRWLLIPLLLPVLFITSIFLWYHTHATIFWLSSVTQILFYSLALIGWVAELLRMSIKWLYIPFYYCFMNLSMLAGIALFLSGKHTVLWEKVERK